MVSSREVDSKVFRLTFNIEYFFDEKTNGESDFRTVRQFLFDMSLDVRTFKVCLFVSNFRFEFE